MLCPFCALQFFVCFVYFVVTLIIHVEQRAFFCDGLRVAGFRFCGLLAGSMLCCRDDAFRIACRCLGFPATHHPPRATFSRVAIAISASLFFEPSNPSIGSVARFAV